MRIRHFGSIETNGFQSQYIRFSCLTDHYILYICETARYRQAPAGAGNGLLKDVNLRRHRRQQSCIKLKGLQNKINLKLFFQTVRKA